MTEEVYESLKNVLARRKKKKTEIMVDGYSGFLLLDKDDKPKVAFAYREWNVMGHSDVGVTLNVYTHASYNRAAEQMAKIIVMKEISTPEKQKKSG